MSLALLGLWAVSSAAGAISVSTTLPQGAVGQPYNTTLSASGGTAPYTHVVTAGALPTGLSLTTVGVLSGTPLSAGQFNFSVQTTDAVNATSLTNLSVTIAGASGLIISTTTLPPGRLSTPYDVTLAAQGGTAPYSFDLLLGGGSLPTGLSLASTGRISGTPTSGGVFPFIVRVTDAGGNSFQSSLSLRIEAASLTISTTSLAGAPANVPYSQAITAVGGTPPYTFDILSGSLPPGITLATSGVLSGTPTNSGTYNFFVRVTDAGGMTAQASYSIVVAGTGPRVIVTSLPTGIVNQPFSGALLAQGGTAPYTFNVLSGSLPPGLTLSSSGSISGTPTASGVYPITVRLMDSAGQTTQADVLINVNSGSFAITALNPADGFVNSPYTLNLATTGGTSTVAYTVLSGTLPPGLIFNVNGVFSGTPTTAGTYQFVIRAIDSLGATAQLPITIKIQSSTLLISQAGLANGSINQSYSSTLSASNGVPPYSFSLASGSLPPGLTLGANGNVSGVPTTGGLYQPTFRVTDANSASATAIVPIFIASNGLSLSTLTLPPARQNQAYAAVLQASGGTTPYSFQLASGNLPDGLTLSQSGLLSGTPTGSTGSSLFTVRVTDAAGASSFVTYNFNVNISNIQLISAAPISGQIGSVYNFSLASSGGSGAVTYSLVSGSLAPGLTLNSNGTISGTPTAAGTYVYTLRASDAGGNSALVSQVITIASSQLAFGTGQLPDVIVGTQYSASLTGVGGLAPYSFSIASGSLPPGLSLAPNGSITGAALSAGAYSVTFRITDANGATATVTRILNVSSTAGFTILSSALPSARRGEAYSTTVIAGGGTAPYTFSLVSGLTLPPGLTLSAAGIISGTPTTDGTSSFIVRAQDATGASVQRALTLSVGATSLNIVNDGLPNATVGTTYNATLLPTGGVAPYNFALASGVLPPGLSLSGTGVLSGNPTTAGAFPIVLTLSDSNGLQIQKAYTVLVGTSGLAFSTLSLPAAYIGQSYRGVLQASGGVTPFTFSIVSGALPAGLTLASNGVIAGQPTAAGQSSVTFRVTDATGASAVNTITLGAVQSTIGFGFNAFPTLTVGQVANFTLTGTGGSSPYTFVAPSGLPAGLTLSSSGVLTGTPTQEGTYSVLVRATDAMGAVVESTFPVTVTAAGFRFTIQTLPNAAVNQPYSQTLTTIGGTGSVSFSLQSGNLPSGMTLTPTGVLSGTPTTLGSFSFTIRAIDSANVTITAPLTLTVGNPNVSFTTNTLPSGTVNQTYSQSLSVNGGTGPYAFSVNSGSLPTGLSLSPAGTISGTPTTTGTFTFTVRVTDNQGQSSTADFLIGIGAVGSPSILAVVSSANYAGDGVAPGEIVLLYGTNLGPATLQSFTVVNNSVASVLGGTRVLFDGVAAPVIYTSANQVAVVVPFSLVGKTSVRVVVEQFGNVSATLQIPVKATKPSVFTQDSSGNGPGAIVNQNTTVNTAQNAADRLSIVSLYLTGLGQTNPASQDGQVVGTVANLVIPVSVTINGQPADVTYAGNAPGLVPGLAQINVRIPAGAVSGANLIRVTSGGLTSTGNVTVFVR